jgi:cysteinyl-tRNA synthetase
MLYLQNTLSGTKEKFTSLKPGVVTLYVCGITPYDYAHVGHARVYVTFDVLFRLLTFLGYQVTYCRNFTDIDDKIIKKARDMYGDQLSYAAVTQQYIRSFHQDMDALNCLRPTFEPRVTDAIPDIIAFIEKLITTGHAYVVDNSDNQDSGRGSDVYFSIDTFATYGRLSKHNLADLHAGARVGVSDKKRNPLDFALWKGEPEGIFWKSPWGYGRPGWHIECSALAVKYLGKHIDIHAGGLDLVFPHHENEIAQSESLFGAPFSHYWMHNGFVRVNQEKMSKSLGNFFTLQQVFEKVHPHVVRFYLLSHQYRAPLEFSFDDFVSARKAYQRLCKAFEEADCSTHLDNAHIKQNPIVAQMLAFLCDDLNTQGALGVLFDRLSTMNADDRSAVKLFVQRVLGLPLELLPDEPIVMTPEIIALIAEREEARRLKNWKRSDEIRDQLRDMGVEVQDKKNKA